MAVIPREQAEKEINDWLDYKRKSASNREKLVESISALVDAVMDGDLVFNEDKTITQILRFPIEDKDGNAVMKKLEYKARLKAETLQQHSQGTKAGDDYGRVNAHIAALTSNPKDVVKKMDVDDYGIASLLITVFFS